MPPQISIPLDLPDVRVLQTELDLRHLPILGRSVYVQLRPKRYQCPYCEDRPTSTQTLSWYEPKSPHTKAYDKYLLLGVVHSTIADVCVKEAIGYQAVVGVVNRYIGTRVSLIREGFGMRPLHMGASTGNIKEPKISPRRARRSQRCGTLSLRSPRTLR